MLRINEKAFIIGGNSAKYLKSIIQIAFWLDPSLFVRKIPT
ncbi:hypothetical protein PSAC2689_40041 [Paraburkholderia sacchari]